MMQAFGDLSNNTVTFSLESDWRDLNYYTSRVMDMVMGSMEGDVDLATLATSVPGMMAEGPWTLAMYANFSQVNVAMGMAMDRMQNLTSGDMNE